MSEDTDSRRIFIICGPEIGGDYAEIQERIHWDLKILWKKLGLNCQRDLTTSEQRLSGGKTFYTLFVVKVSMSQRLQ